MSIHQPLSKELSLSIGRRKKKNLRKVQMLKQRSRTNKFKDYKNLNKANLTKFRILMSFRRSICMSSSQPKFPNTISSTFLSSTNQIESTSTCLKRPRNLKKKINKKPLPRNLFKRVHLRS